MTATPNLTKTKRRVPPAPASIQDDVVLKYHWQLERHPENMRTRYPVTQVKRMAKSIKAHNGVLHPLLITPSDRPGIWWVVDGNVRLAGAQLLGNEAPALRCAIVDATPVQQQAIMATTARVRFAVDPVSEARHYAAMRAAGESIAQIARRTGLAQNQIYNRLALLELDEEILQLIQAKELPADRRAAHALAEVSPEIRVALARRLAKSKATIPEVQAACRRAVEEIESRRALEARLAAEAALAAAATTPAQASLAQASVPVDRVAVGAPGAGQAAGHLAGQWSPRIVEPVRATGVAAEAVLEAPGGPTSTWHDVRAAAAAVCDKCMIRTEQLGGRYGEPAWLILSHGAQAVCPDCTLREVVGACRGCPALQLLEFTVAAARRRVDEMEVRRVGR